MDELWTDLCHLFQALGTPFVEDNTIAPGFGKIRPNAHNSGDWLAINRFHNEVSHLNGDSDSDQAYIEDEDDRKARRREQRQHLKQAARINAAERDWQDTLRELDRTHEIIFDNTILSMFTLDHDWLLDIRLDALKRHRVRRVFFILENQFGEPVYYRPNADDALAARMVQVGVALGCMAGLRHLSFCDVSIPLVSSIVAACRQNESLDITFKQLEFLAITCIPELTGYISTHPSLKKLTLNCFRFDLFSLCPSIATMATLEKLKLSGTTGHPLSMVSPENSASFVSIFDSSSLKQVELDNIDFASADAAQSFCAALSASRLEKLKIGSRVNFLAEIHEDLAKAIVSSRLRQLDLDAVVSPEFLSAFHTAFTESYDSVLEKLSLSSQSKSLKVYCRGRDGNKCLLERLDTVWLQSVKRILTMNYQRRACPPLFAAIDEAPGERARRLRAVEAFDALVMPILYEYLHRNDCNLRGMIQQVAEESKTVTHNTKVFGCIVANGRTSGNIDS